MCIHTAVQQRRHLRGVCLWLAWLKRDVGGRRVVLNGVLFSALDSLNYNTVEGATIIVLSSCSEGSDEPSVLPHGL